MQPVFKETQRRNSVCCSERRHQQGQHEIRSFRLHRSSDIPLDQTYEERLTLIQSLEAAGFYGYHLSEHHATPLSMTPSPSIFLAAAARETKRIRLGTLLYLLPLYHPMRLLEELCMLDQLSGGRLDIGIGRGISPHEFEAFHVDFAESGTDFDHCFNVLHQGFTHD